MQDMNKKQADRRIAMRDARAQQNGGVDLIDELRRNADSLIEQANERKKLADAAQPLYASLNEQQKNRFADMLFGGDRERDNRRMDRTFRLEAKTLNVGATESEEGRCGRTLHGSVAAMRRAVSDQAAVGASVRACIARELRNKGDRQCGHIR